MKTYDDETGGHRRFALPGARSNYGPDKTVAVEHIDLHVTLDYASRSIDGVVTMTVRALDEPVQSLVLNAIDTTISRASRDDKDLRVASRDDAVEVFFDPAIAPNERTTFAVAYRVVNPRHGLFFVAPTAAYPDKVTHAWTQSQDQNARFWFPCLDYPHEKQTTQTTIVTKRGEFALANGALFEKRDDGEKTIWTYKQDVPHSTYLMTVVTGPFVEKDQGVAGSGKTPVAYYVLPGREADGERSFAATPRMIEAFEEKIGTAYPYARYSQIAVQDFIFGGMENTSATTQTDRTLHDETAHLDFSSDPLVSHELAHQWFGDLLTCRDWSHAWLNEGFATYFETVWREADLGYDEYQYDNFECVGRYLEEDSDRYRRPIVCNRYRDPIELFDRHLYEKGGATLHMLRGELGDARFWRSIRHYVEKNKQRNVETIDLIRAIEESTGRNMRGFFDQWVFRGGHPELEVRAEWDEKRKVATITVDQKQSVTADAPAYVFDVDLGLLADAPQNIATNVGPGALPGEKRIRLHVEREHETFTIPLEAEPQLIRFDPGAYILGSATTKFGVGRAATTLASDPSPVSRIRAARELAGEGSKTAREALATAFAKDPFYGVLIEAAAAIGKTRAPWANAILLDALKHEHPKVRRAAAAALGSFRDRTTAKALIATSKDASYFVRASALLALGKTRDPLAFATLEEALQGHSWNATVQAGAVRGLAELAEPRATDTILWACEIGRDEGLRRAAVVALGRQGELVESERTRIVGGLDRYLDDPSFLVSLAAIAAAESLGDARLLGSLARAGANGFDGRVRRDAEEASIRIREARTAPAQISGLREDVDALRDAHRKLAEKIEAFGK